MAPLTPLGRHFPGLKPASGDASDFRDITLGTNLGKQRDQPISHHRKWGLNPLTTGGAGGSRPAQVPFSSPRRPDPKPPLHVASPSQAPPQTAPLKPQTRLPPGAGAETPASALLEFTPRLCTIFEEGLTTHIHRGSFSSLAGGFALAQTREIATSFTNTAAPRRDPCTCPAAALTPRASLT